jgi:AcrR family transcriptional regulator
MARPRKDAIRSRALIIAAADELLAENADASFAEIGIRAGLTPATVYRHFSDRSSLLGAVLEATLERFEATTRGWELGPDSFEELLRQMAVQQAVYRGLMSRIRAGQVDGRRRGDLRERTIALYSEPLTVAKQAGQVKASFKDKDVLLVVLMVEGVVAARTEDPEVAATEALDLIMAGLRP